MSKKQAKQSEYKRLDPELLKEITNCVIDRLREEETVARKARYDRKRANTKLLLRNYRSLTDHCESAIYDASQMDDEADLAEILEMMSGNRGESFRVESIRESAVRTRIIIDHINEMLGMYQIFCERSPRIEDNRRYRIICAMYIDEEVKTPDDIAEEEHVDRSTVYRDIETAIERLTALIFGIDGLYLLQR